jgi:UDP:flavonoid glycosyltransferase YjiC (YdhE family)
VFHGGSATLTAALSYALPMVMVPLGADQPDNADRCARAGLAVVVPAAERSPHMLRRAVLEVLADSRYRTPRIQLHQRACGALP